MMRVEEYPVCMGMDAMRLCMGIPTRNFTRNEVVAWIDAMQSVSPSPLVERKIARAAITKGESRE